MSGDGERREQAVTGLYVATVYGLTVNPGPGVEQFRLRVTSSDA